MLFTSLAFFVLLALTFIVYYLPLPFFKKANTQLLVLILASVIFYGYYSPKLLLLLAFSGAVNVVTSYYVGMGHPKYRMLMASAGVIINLSVLAFFKYSPLIATTFFNSANGIGRFLLTVPPPIGISFFTFEGISLVIDTYKGNTDTRFQNLVDKSFKTHLRNSFFFIVFFFSAPGFRAYT